MKASDAELTEAAMAFESAHYPHATPETQRLLAHSRGTIRRFLDSDWGRWSPPNRQHP